MSTTAYGLRADFADGFGGGVVSFGPDGSSLDLGELFPSPDAVVVVDELDAELLALLDAQPALKRVPAEDRAATLRRYDFMGTDALRHEAARRGITGAGSASSSSIRAGLVEQDRRVLAGELATSGPLAELAGGIVADEPTVAPAEPAPPRKRRTSEPAPAASATTDTPEA